ncbi:hypothetical protein SAMN04488104_100894 [Algoriphagus faecimaris]|uniref:Uncharacterized protein n=1 Tax=Algoriphagus faecimaris TaxID=686796 RepID=A0A1G6Q833_9BACT|nr:hypothetical protein [Algoriphagus faecimaris]SDC88493.1 hypothetical protein SAMN04488104_100894 [Algoriphagus faecimaris]
MLNFFRKIRQKLLQQNQVTRYLAYSVGEIFLVVIGILVALQVNNRNEVTQLEKLGLHFRINRVSKY